MTLSLIVAVSENGVIGNRGRLPWHISADLRRFKRITMGHHIVMGRRTFESIGRSLSGRTMVVMTRQTDYTAPQGVIVVHTIDQALQVAREDDEVFFVGGRNVYVEALNLVSRLYVTRVHASVEGDVTFPEPDLSKWNLIETDRRSNDPQCGLEYSFLVFERQS